MYLYSVLIPTFFLINSFLLIEVIYIIYNSFFGIFSFPKDPHQQQLWIKATGRSNWKPTKFTRICSRHFDEKLIVKKSHTTRLDGSAVPNINVHVSKKNCLQKEIYSIW